PLTSDVYVKALDCKSMVILSDKDTIVKPMLSKKLIQSFLKPPLVVHFDTLKHGDIAMSKDVWKTIMNFLR
ncbi:MAG: alpha/beta hydrolase, partial [Clostridium sp.]